MTMVAGGQNEANKTFAPELFVNLTLFFNHFSCGYETYRICTIEDEEHFDEVGLRLTLHLGREMRLTTIICVYLLRLTPIMVDYISIVKFNRLPIISVLV